MMTRRLMPVVLLACLAVPIRADILEQILVKVNGEIFTKTDLEKRQVQMLRSLDPELRLGSLSDEELKTRLAEVTPDILVGVVDEMLLVQRGRELGYRLADDQFENIIEQIKKDNKIETDAEFQAALDQEGLTMQELRRELERRMLVERVQQAEVMPKVGITEEEAQRYYEGHPDEFRKPATVTLREILVEVPTSSQGVNVAEDEAALERAQAVRARVLGGEDFARVAAEVSDAPSKANGGLVGPIQEDELAPAFLKAIDGLKPGEMSEPLRTTRGYHLVKLESETRAVLPPFDEVRDLIADRVFAEKRRAELQKYLAKLRAQALIEWKNDELKKQYETRLASPPSAEP